MLISIIIPVYNASKYLSRMIDCILNQRYHRWELILVDDGSTDDSATIIHTFNDSRIHYIYQQNSGPGAARNRGLEMAKGDYICFIDADDWFDEELLQKYGDAIKEKHWDIVFQGFCREKEDGIVTELPLAMNADTDTISKEEIICRLYKGHVYGWSWCKMFRREIIEKHHIRFDEGLRLWEDELFTSHFLQYASSIKTLDCRHYHYVLYPQSLMNTNNTYLKRLALSELMNDALEPLANEELSDYLNDTYNKNLKFSMLMALMNKADHKCSEAKKEELLEKYYARCKQYPSLRWHNSLKNRLSYTIAEAILCTHSTSLILKLFSKL